MVKKGENIYKRKDGRWEGRYIKERDINQRIVYGYIYGKKYFEVKEKLTVMKAKMPANPRIIDKNTSILEEWMSFWLVNIMKKNIKSSTYYTYKRLINKQIIPNLGQYPIHLIDSQKVQSFVDHLHDRDLSPGTIRNIFNVLKKSLNTAVQQNHIYSNPCDKVILPKYKRKKVHSLTIAQQKKIETLALQEEGCSPVILALYSGMRIGEISGLKWSDIDFTENTIAVRRTVSRVLDERITNSITKVYSDTPKTAQSERIIPLPKNLKAYLKKKYDSSSSEHVISCKGRVAEPRVINYRFSKLVKRIGLREIHFHILRHTFATRCLENGVDIASLSRLMGHQSTRMTLDIYTDSMLEKRQAAMQIVDNLLESSN
ncbi:hypothetical protein UAY_02741 [Enterococcus moraviensis ATCC BAA-383]|uniref:Tyr recombinase domain-containing protein n=1 Tax=Enterococcus moraviensis ATCC BAA-383 TaxID=1158609 RepID=R2T9W6_9ENTE|nr:site-specific integrase [Enterococcus moraviensis]EOH97009.1 hypothetical protein UAY_02741 [Enterococcus moraviensis ATCC BAA-383]EOT65799.1 hypothetical protein I586_02068 [Enterococcus moraviensis ATCC BAA-383]OJG68429.1 hypothetical protein RV09_GL001676 [Enterococcus moraviensis]